MAVRLKRLFCIALAMMCLASCGRDADGTAETAAPRKTDAPEIAPARDLVEDVTGDAGWSALRLTEDDDGGVAVAQEGIYLLHVWELRRLDRGGESDELICTLPEGSDRNARAIASDGSGVYLALYFAEEERCEIRFYSETGDERVVTGLGTEGLSPYGLCCDGERLYLMLANFYGSAKLLVLSRDGEQEYELELSGISSLASGGGNVYVGSGKPKEIFRVDNDSRELVKLTALSDGRLVGAGEEVIYIGDDTSVYEMDAQTLETRRLLDWTSCGVSGSGKALYRDGGNFVVSDISGILHLTPREGPARRRVVLGVNGTAHIVSYDAVAFNMENDEYEIIVRDYGVYEEPQAVLGAEMAAGAGPDLIDADSFSPDLLRAGVMTDLMTLLENDGEVGPDDLLAGPLRAMQTEKGELFAIAPTFHVETIVRHADGAGTLVKGMREFVSAASSLEALGDPETAFAGTFCREDFLRWAFCRAEGAMYSEEDVRAILEYAAALPLRENQNWLGSGSAAPLLFSNAVNLFTASLDYFGDTELDNLEVFGVPFCEGTGLLYPRAYLAIPCGSAEVQGAWEYIKFVMRDADTFDLSLYKPAYLENKAEIERYAKQGKLLISYDIYGDYAWIESESRDLAFCELFELVLDGLGGVYVQDGTLLDLVNRASAAYFAGEGTVDEAARAVCSRLELYLGERYG